MTDTTAPAPAPATPGGSRPAIGVDVGGTKIAGALVAADGRVLDRERVDTPAERTEELVEAASAIITTLLRRGGDDVAGVGLAVAALLDPRTGHVWFAPNLPWQDVDLGRLVEGQVGRPVVLENDANAAAWGEYRHGAGAEEDDMVLLTVGTGVGGGCVVDDHLLHGAFGIAGELGHITLDPGGPVCGCGNRGCLEAMASGTALVRDARDLAASSSPLGEALRGRCGGDVARLEGRDVTELAREGDRGSTELLEDLGTHLGHGMASICAVLDPRVIVVGGGVGEAGDLLLGPARTAFARHLVGRGHRPVPEVVPARLGTDAGVVGAATLAREAGR